MGTHVGRIDVAELNPCLKCGHDGTGVEYARNDITRRWSVDCLNCGYEGPIRGKRQAYYCEDRQSWALPLTRGKVALIDAEDAPNLTQNCWTAFAPNGFATNPARRHWYAGRSVRVNGKGKLVLMHRQLVHAPEHMHVDHINHDTLDNRKANLRICTPSQNQCNQAIIRGGTSQYKGVYWHKGAKKWAAQIRFQDLGRQKSLGFFATEESAARAYDEAAITIYGEFAFTNLPSEGGA